MIRFFRIFTFFRGFAPFFPVVFVGMHFAFSTPLHGEGTERAPIADSPSAYLYSIGIFSTADPFPDSKHSPDAGDKPANRFHVPVAPEFPPSLEELLETGRRLRRSEAFQDAIRIFYLAVQRKPGEFRSNIEYAQTLLGFALKQRDPSLLRESLQRLRKCESLISRDQESNESRLCSLIGSGYSCLAMLRDDPESWRDSVEYWESALSRNPENTDGYKKYVWSLIKSGKTDSLEEHLNFLLETSPNDPFVHDLCAMRIAEQIRGDDLVFSDFSPLHGRFMEHCLSALENAVSAEKAENIYEGDFFYQLLKNEPTPANRIREMICPGEIETYVNRMRALKEEGPDLYEKIVRIRLLRTFHEEILSEKVKSAARELLQSEIEEYGIDPIFCLEYGLSFDFSDPGARVQSIGYFDRIIKEGTFRETGVFARAIATASFGYANNQENWIEKSIADFEKTLGQYPAWERISLELGRAYQRLGIYRRAEEIFLEGIRRNPESSRLHEETAKLCFLQWTSSPEELQYAKRAFYHAERFASSPLREKWKIRLAEEGKFHPELIPEAFSYEELMEEGTAYFRMRNWDLALQRMLFLKSRIPDPESRIANSLYESIGCAYYAKGDLDGAVENLMYCVHQKENASGISAVDLCVDAMFRGERYEDIVSFYHEYLLSDPQRKNRGGIANYYAVRALGELGDESSPYVFQFARPLFFSRMEFLDFEKLRFLVKLATDAGECEFTEKRLTEFYKSGTLRDKIPGEKLLVLIGHCRLQQEKPLQAGRIFSYAIKLNPNFPEAYLGRYKAALKVLEDDKMVDDPKRRLAFEKQAEKDKTRLIKYGLVSD